MAKETYISKAIIEVSQQTYSGKEKVKSQFDHWIATAAQWGLTVTVTLPPEFCIKGEDPENAHVKD